MSAEIQDIIMRPEEPDLFWVTVMHIWYTKYSLS